MKSAPWILAATLLAVACSSPEERLAKHLERGEAYLEEDRHEEALLEFQSALNLRPDDAALYERVGHVLYDRNRYSESLQYFAHAHRLDPSRVEAAMLEARLLGPQNIEAARRIVQRALAEDPDRAVVQRTVSHLALLEGDIALASSSAHRATALAPDDPESWAQLGAVFETRIQDRARRGRPPRDDVFEAAVSAFERVHRLDPTDPRGRLLQARTLAAWPGHEEEALEAFEGALGVAREGSRRDNLVLVARTYGTYAERLGRDDLQRRVLRELLSIEDGNYEAWLTLARLAAADDPLQAEGVYLELLGRRPQDAQAHLMYANYLVRTERAEDAEAHLRQSIEGGVDQPGLWEWLVRLKIQQGRPAAARATFVELAERHPKSPLAQTAQVRLALAEGRPDEALRLLDPLLRKSQAAELRRLQALAEHRLGDQEAAWQAIVRATTADAAPNPAALRLRARIAHDSRRWPEVVDATRRLTAADQELTSSDRVVLAVALDATGERDRAHGMLKQLLAERPGDPAVALAYAKVRAEEDPEAVQAALAAAFESTPGDPDLIETLTARDVAAGRTGEALERLGRLASAGLATPRTLLVRAKLLAQLGSYDEAEADVLRAFEANPGLPGAIDLLYALYAAQGRLEEARRSFEQAEEAGVLHSGARQLLARLYLGEGEPARARDMLEQVVADRPGLWSARNDLAWVLADLGEDLDRALVLAREAQIGSGNQPATSDTLGWVHLKAGRYEAGLKAFRRAIRLAEQRDTPANPSFRYHEGLALEGLGRDEEAARAFEEALALGDFAEAEDARQRLEAARNPEPEARRPS